MTAAIVLGTSVTTVTPAAAAPPIHDTADDTADDTETPAPGGVVIAGYHGVLAQTLVVPVGRAVIAPGVARAHFRLPDLVVDATVSATLNDEPIGSWLLGAGPSETEIDIVLPAARFLTGRNTLRLETSVPLTVDGTCVDPRHPARWVELVEPLAITIPTGTDGQLRLADFPGVIEDASNSTTIAIGSIDGPHLSAAAIVGAAAIAEFGRDHTITLQRLGAAEYGSEQPQIVVAVGDRPGISVEPLDGDTAQVHIIGGDVDHLVAMARSLGQAGSRAAMSGDRIGQDDAVALLTDRPPVRQTASPEWFEGVSLDSLGYGPATLDSPGVDSVSYSVDLPVGGRAGSMRLDVAAAATLDGPGWSPGVDVLVNGRVAGNVPLDTSIERAIIDVPTELLRPGTNFVRLEADFGRAATSCAAPTPPTHRVDILGTTTIQLVEATGVEPLLDDLPYLLRTDADTTSTAVIAPSSPSLGEAERAVRLAVLLGGRGLAATVVTADEDVAEPTSARHLVIFGTADRQPRFAAVAERVPLGVEIPDRWPAEIEHQLDGNVHAATIQLARLADSGVLIAIVGATDADAIAAADIVLDPSLRRDLVGATVIAGTDPLAAQPVALEPAGAIASTSTPEPGDTVPVTSEPAVADAPDEAAPAATTPVIGLAGGQGGSSNSRLELRVLATIFVTVAGLGCGIWWLLRRAKAGTAPPPAIATPPNA